MPIVRWTIILSAAILISACVKNEADMKEFVAQVKKTAKGSITPLPPLPEIIPVAYTAQNLRSPFALTGGAYVNSPDTVTGAGGEVIKQEPRPDIKRPREYLEQFPLSTFTMVGTLSKPSTSWGLVKDGLGMIHAIKVGDYMGLNSGKVVAITPDQIRLNETIPNGRGGWMQSRTVLNLIVAPPSTDSNTSTSAPPSAVPTAPAAPGAQPSKPPAYFPKSGGG